MTSLLSPIPTQKQSRRVFLNLGAFIGGIHIWGESAMGRAILCYGTYFSRRVLPGGLWGSRLGYFGSGDGKVGTGGVFVPRPTCIPTRSASHEADQEAQVQEGSSAASFGSPGRRALRRPSAHVSPPSRQGSKARAVQLDSCRGGTIHTSMRKPWRKSTHLRRVVFIHKADSPRTLSNYGRRALHVQSRTRCHQASGNWVPTMAT